MASSIENLSSVVSQDVPDAKGMKFGIVRAEWNTKITTALTEGCKQFLIECGADEKDIEVADVPGSFELPMGAKIMLGKESFDAIICLGCIIKGETKHDEYIGHAVATAIAQLNIVASKPVIFGVLTPNSMEQAEDRSGGKHGNKGVEAAATAVKMAHLKKNMQQKKKTIGF